MNQEEQNELTALQQKETQGTITESEKTRLEELRKTSSSSSGSSGSSSSSSKKG
jgi:cell shape-determining protein MreC